MAMAPTWVLPPRPTVGRRGIQLSHYNFKAKYAIASLGDQCVRANQFYSSGVCYFEILVELARSLDYNLCIGVASKQFDCKHPLWSSNYEDCWAYASCGTLWHEGTEVATTLSEFVEGDRVGVLLHFEAGYIGFYHNRKLQKPCIQMKKPTVPLVAAANFYAPGHAAWLLPLVSPPTSVLDDVKTHSKSCSIQ